MQEEDTKYYNSIVREIRKIVVTKLILQETGTYNPMFYRPYTSSIIDTDSVNKITERIATTNFDDSISPMLFSGMGMSTICPSADHDQKIYIPGDWNEKRFIFLLELECLYTNGSVLVHVIQGYTDRVAVSYNNSIDPDMVMFINNVSEMVKFNIRNNLDVNQRVYVNGASQVISDPEWGNNTNDRKYIMRPQDIIQGIQSNHLGNINREFPESIGGLLEYNPMLDNNPYKSSRVNTIPTNYLSSIIGGHIKATVQSPEFMENAGGKYGKTRQYLSQKEGLAFENVIIRLLCSSDYGIRNYFQYKDLANKLDPNVDNVVMVGLLGRYNNQAHSAGSTAYWNGSDQQTVIATILSQAIPSLMMECLLYQVGFRATNYDYDGKINIIFYNIVSMTDGDSTRHITMFKNRLETEILHDITYGNIERFSLDVDSKITGDTSIKISYAGEPFTDFTAPTFCDNLYSPVIASNGTEFVNITSDLERIISNTSDVLWNHNFNEEKKLILQPNTVSDFYHNFDPNKL